MISVNEKDKIINIIHAPEENIRYVLHLNALEANQLKDELDKLLKKDDK